VSDSKGDSAHAYLLEIDSAEERCKSLNRLLEDLNRRHAAAETMMEAVLRHGRQYPERHLFWETDDLTGWETPLLAFGAYLASRPKSKRAVEELLDHEVRVFMNAPTQVKVARNIARDLVRHAVAADEPELRSLITLCDRKRGLYRDVREPLVQLKNRVMEQEVLAAAAEVWDKFGDLAWQTDYRAFEPRPDRPPGGHDEGLTDREAVPVPEEIAKATIDSAPATTEELTAAIAAASRNQQALSLLLASPAVSGSDDPSAIPKEAVDPAGDAGSSTGESTPPIQNADGTPNRCEAPIRLENDAVAGQTARIALSETQWSDPIAISRPEANVLRGLLDSWLRDPGAYLESEDLDRANEGANSSRKYLLDLEQKDPRFLAVIGRPRGRGLKGGYRLKWGF
jgi:hypothetical protein